MHGKVVSRGVDRNRLRPADPGRGRRIIAAKANLLCRNRKIQAQHREYHVVDRRQMKSPALKRVYDPPNAGDGTRILVDRLWPRGIARDRARIDLWLRDIAPSDALRKRFHGKSDDWDAFCAAYFAELEDAAAQAAASDLRDRLRKGPITLLYAARDERRNNAVALRMWLERQRDRRA